MDEQLYREAILERYANLLNQGEIDKPDFEATLLNPLCGDEVKLQLKVKKEIIEKARFSGNGCALSQVSASLLAEYVEGKTLTEAKNFDSKALLNLLGINPTPSRLKCVLLSRETLKKSLSK